MEIIGHRGAAGLEFENTINGILKAIEIGVKWIEIDVWKTVDNEIIVFHDTYLDRLSNKKGFVKDYQYSELKNIKLLDGEHIPTLNQVVQVCKEKEIGLLVELKDEDALMPTLEILQSNLTNEEYIIGSFFHEPIKRVKEIDNNIQTSIMFECVPINLKDYLLAINPDYVTTSIESYNNYLISTVKELNKKLIFYTINIKPEIELAQLAEPFGIITNYPNLFLKT